MRHLLLSTALTLSFGLCPTYAQTADEDAIVVTATRAPSLAARLPAEIDVIDANAARARGDATIADALRDAPGLGVVVAGGAGQQASLFSGGGNSNHTLVLFDGLRVNDPSTPGSSFDAGQDMLGDLERIEVVQGPMSAVFGSDALGGVVNLLPRHGGEGALNARLDLAIGSLGTVQGGAGVDGTLGAFRYAVSAEGYANDGYDLVPERMSTHNGERDRSSMTTVTGVFDLALSNAFAIDLLLRQRRAQADFDAFPFDLGTFQEFRAEGDNLQISQNDLTLARLGATWVLNDALSLRATYGGMRQERVQTDEGADTDLFQGDRRFGDVTLTWTPDDVTDVVAGVSSENDEVDIAQGFGFPPPSSFLKADENHLGVFVTAQRDFDRLTLTAAVRADDYEGFGTNSTWRAGASYNVLTSTRIYAAYGTSFRAPTLYERFVPFGNEALDPESARSWEVGADTHWPAFGQERGLELRALYRHSDIEDLIDFDGSFTYANVDRATIDTAQLRAAARPFDWLTLRAAYVYTDARDEVADTALLRRPENYWTADIAIVQGPYKATLSWRDVGERADQLYGDDGFALGVGESPSYAVTRLSGAYSFGHSEIFVAADNIFDETYEAANAFAGAPANVRVGVRLRTGS